MPPNKLIATDQSIHLEAFWLTAIFLMALANTVILGSEPHGTHDYILFSDGSKSLQALLSSTDNKVRVTLRLAASRQSVRLCLPPQLGPMDRVGTTCKWRQNPVSETSCVLNKNRTMNNFMLLSFPFSLADVFIREKFQMCDFELRWQAKPRVVFH
jgi:hypothetical protein